MQFSGCHWLAKWFHIISKDVCLVNHLIHKEKQLLLECASLGNFAQVTKETMVSEWSKKLQDQTLTTLLQLSRAPGHCNLMKLLKEHMATVKIFKDSRHCQELLS